MSAKRKHTQSLNGKQVYATINKTGRRRVGRAYRAYIMCDFASAESNVSAAALFRGLVSPRSGEMLRAIGRDKTRTREDHDTLITHPLSRIHLFLELEKVKSKL